MQIVGPTTVRVAHLRYPIQLPDGFSYFKIETQDHGRFYCGVAPMIRDAAGQRMELPEELWSGSVVKLALDSRGRIAAVQVLQPCWFDPFSASG